MDEDGETTFGLHGTSIEAIKHLAVHGRMPNSGLSGHEFHFCPRTGTKYTKGPYGEAVYYAQVNASRNALIAALRKSDAQLDDKFIKGILQFAEPQFAYNEDWNLTRRILKCLDMETIRKFNCFIDQILKKSRGLIIGILPTVQELGPTQGADEDLVVTVPQGLPIQYISGIEPLGQTEWHEIFDNDLKNVHLLY